MEAGGARRAHGRARVLTGSVGHRYASADEGRWNLALGDLDPALTLLGRGRPVEVDLPRFDAGETEGGGVMRRGVPVVDSVGLVTTVFDLVVAQYGVARDGLPGSGPLVMTTRSPIRLPGRRRSPRCPRRPRRASAGSSPETQSCRGAAR